MTEEREILETGENYEVISEPGEINPKFYVTEAELTEEDLDIISTLQKSVMASGEINAAGSYDEIRKDVSRMLEDLFSRHLPFVSEEEKIRYLDLVLRNMFGYGRIQPLVDNDDLEEIMVNGINLPVMVFHPKFGMCETNIIFETEDEIKNIIDRIGFRIKRKIDLANPLMDARLPDGSRVNATISPITADGPTITIRKFRDDPLTILDLIRFNTIDSKIAAFLWICTEGMGSRPLNMIIAGGTGSGKTTTLNCVADFINPSNRLITLEDTLELNLRPFNNLVRGETRPANVEGRGGVSMEDLMINSLRMRPDRLIVGEVRGPEAQTLFTAMNTGHDGCMGTLHANNAGEVVTRLTNPPMDVPDIMLPSLDVIVIQKRLKYKGKNVRRVTEIADVRSIKKGSDIEITVSDIAEWDASSDKWGELNSMQLLDKIRSFAGITMDKLLEEIEVRQTILEWMAQQDIKGRQNVRQMIQKYYLDPVDFIKFMVGETSG